MAAFKLNVADLVFVLKQIKIGEANSAAHSGDNAVALTKVWVDANGNTFTIDPLTDLPYTAEAAALAGYTLAIPSPMAPFGIRTVDGSFNNIVEGRETWGAADQAMARLLPSYYRDEADGEQVDLNGPNVPGGVVDNTNYGSDGNVVDSDPRLISNLIADMSFNNPAAIVAALSFAEFNGEWSGDVYGAGGALETIQTAFADLHAVLSDPLGDHAAANATFDAAVAVFGVVRDGNSISIPNIAPDEGLSTPFNAWMTFFGQFFDHGLDLINKGNNGTVYVPLPANDPLRTHGPDGIAGNGDEVPPQQAFMVLTRATPNGDTETNQTTPVVDQNQTYTSNASHQAFLREYALEEGLPKATGHLLDGSEVGEIGGVSSLPTWADVKAQALSMLGIRLTDLDVGNIPVLRMDPYGEFIRGPNGMPQILAGVDVNGVSIWVETSIANPVNPSAIVLVDGATLLGGIVIPPGGEVSAVRTGHAFLDDIAHSAAPVVSGGVLQQDADTDVGNAVASLNGRNTEYDNELLDQHFITGDGRGNENVGLTAVHHIFHSEHNRQVEQQKLTILKSGDLAFINEWLETDIDQATLDGLAGLSLLDLTAEAATMNWDGERMFQAARMATEMQYQHLVFEEFGRKIQPNIDPFVFNTTPDINPAIFAEFAHVVYRFGHSMLTDNMPRLDSAGETILGMKSDGTTMSAEEFGLVASFLNPVAYDANGTMSDDEGAAAIIRGMTIERGNEIDEFLVDALRNNLLGLPLDLAAINIARGRDTGMPSLNQARQALYDASGSTFLEPYANWVDFAANLKNPVSVINFIAAYGTHETITSATTAEAKRDAAWALVFGGDGAPADRLDFLNATGAYADKGGLDEIDIWIGGLAEKKMPFGGFLGSTFNAVFELQMENLQDGDRFYYLTRTQGQNFLVALEQNAFAKMMYANTALADPGADGIRGTEDDVITRHIGVDSFGVYDFVLEVNIDNQADYTPLSDADVAAANAAVSAAQAAYEAAVAAHADAIAAHEAAVGNADLTDAAQLQLAANAALATANLTNASTLLVAAMNAFNAANATDAVALLAAYNSALAAASADPVALRATANSLQATADLTDAVDLRTTADTLQDTADLTDAVALRNTATTAQDNADLTDAVALRNTANTLQDTADLTDAVALRTTANTLQDTADLTDAVALRTTANTLQDTADLTDAVALRTTANTLQDTADLTDAVALRTTANTLQTTANTTDAILLRAGANQLQNTADQTDAVALRTTANDLLAIANNTGLQADIDAAALADTAADNAELADDIAAAFDATADAAELADANAAAADAAADAAELADANAATADAAADAAELADANAAAADATADGAEAADAGALAADVAADAAELADANALAADATADAAELADANAVTADAAADVAEAADANALATDAAADAAELADANAAAADAQADAAEAADAAAVAADAAADAAENAAANAASALVALNAALAADAAATVAFSAYSAAADADAAAMAAQTLATAAAAADAAALAAGQAVTTAAGAIDAADAERAAADAALVAVMASGDGKDPVGNNPVLEAAGLGKVVRADANSIRVQGGEHVVVGGTEFNDTIITDFGDDGIWGGAGDDRIESGAGVDLVNGGAGNDIITDSGDTGDFLKGDEGDDVISGGNGLDVIMGGTGNDVIFHGVDDTETFAGEGNDFVLGGAGVDLIMGNEGDDWLEGGAGFDTTAGDNSELFFDSRIIGHDVMFSGSEEHDFDAESGDDIMVQGESVLRSEGQFGFDWVTYKGNSQNADVDLARPIFTTEVQDVLRDRFDKVEAASGFTGNDLLVGDDRIYDAAAAGGTNGAGEGVFFRDDINQTGIDRIDGLDQIITDEEMFDGVHTSEFGDLKAVPTIEKIFAGGNVLIGGAGDDTLIGKGGNDILDGDRWLNVRIRLTAPNGNNTQEEELATIDSLTHVFTAPQLALLGIDEAYAGRSLSALMIDRLIVPSQLHIVREILDGGQEGDVDTAVFWDVVQNYTIELNEDGAYVVTHNVVGNPAVMPPGFANRVSDGVDVLRNIEKVKFGDGNGGFVTFDIADVVQQPATGAAVLQGDWTPIEGQTLTASIASIADPNGIASFAFQWQSSVDGVTFTDIDGETAATLNIPDAEGTALGALHGLFLRSVVTLTDLLGGTQVFETGPTTGRVGMNLDVSDSPVGVTFVAPNTDDVLTGSDFNDSLRAGPGNDQVFGGLGNDLLVGGQGHDLIDGGAGTDTASWDMTLNDFSNIAVNPGTLDISVTSHGIEGTATPGGSDVIRNAEFLRFGGAGAGGTSYAIITGAIEASGGAGSQALFGGVGADLLRGRAGNDIVVGGAGNDELHGGADNDWFFQVGATDGRDLIFGGVGTDTYVLSGVAGAETFNIYTRAAYLSANPGALLTGGNATEIVITRNGAVISELLGIEEIKVNSLLTTEQNGNGVVDGGSTDGDTVNIFGDFTSTSLLYNTIRVNGSSANDTVNISGLESDHRIVFTANGGSDTVVGSVRQQDTIVGSVNDLRTTGGTTFGSQDGLDAMVGGSVMSALIAGSDAGEVSRGRTMIEMDQIFPLDTVETGPVEPVFVNDAPVELTERQVITDYLVS
jgi:hypothetical protein